MASLPASPSMIYPPSLPPLPVGSSTQAPAATVVKPVMDVGHHRDENSLNARLFAVLNSIEKSNEESKEAPVPAYVKWGLPFLVATQVATLGLLAFNMNEMAALKSCQHSMENTIDNIKKDVLDKKSLQDLLIVGQELLSGATMRNPDLQQFSNAVTALKKNMETKELVDTATGVVNMVKGVNAFWQSPLCKLARKSFNPVSQALSYVFKERSIK